MSTHEFLSPTWIDAVRAIRDDYTDRVEDPEVEIVANVTVTDAPFAEPTVRGHVDTTARPPSIDVGHVDHAQFGIELPYTLALQVFIERDPATVLTVMLGGHMKLTGDSSKVMELAGAVPSEPPADDAAIGVAREILARVDAVTQRD